MTATTTATKIASHDLAPGPIGHPILGSFAELQRDPLSLFINSAGTYGDVVRFRFGPRIAHLISHPDAIKHVLQDNQKNYSKETRGIKVLRQFLGMGLLTSDGESWFRQRRITQPAFHRQRIAALGALMVKEAEVMADAWRAPAVNKRPLDIASEMMKLTLRIASGTLLSTDVSREADVVGNAVTVLLETAKAHIFTPLPLPFSIPTAKNREYRAAMRALDAIVFRIIDERRRGKGAPEDLLSMLLHAKDEATGEGMSDKQLRDEVMTIFLAGHETTANALTWTFYLLSKHPLVRRALRAELDDVLGGRPPTTSDLPRLKYTAMVIDESMRLYPPAWMMTRATRSHDTILGYFIPKGSYVLMSPYVTHRRPSLWENPEGFDPDRFAPERAAAMSRFAYFPFGGGPRQCIGNTFALMEAALLLATLAQRYRLDLVPGHPVEPQPLVTLRPKHGLQMIVVNERELGS